MYILYSDVARMLQAPQSTACNSVTVDMYNCHGEVCSSGSTQGSGISTFLLLLSLIVVESDPLTCQDLRASCLREKQSHKVDLQNQDWDPEQVRLTGWLWTVGLIMFSRAVIQMQMGPWHGTGTLTYSCAVAQNHAVPWRGSDCRQEGPYNLD